MAAIFSLFYLLSVVGYGVEFHYCLGRVTDVNLDWVGTSCACDGSHAERAMKCCDELAIKVQIDDEHQANASLDQVVKAPAALIQQIESADLVADADDACGPVVMDNGPPEQRRFLRHCALIFYA